MIPTTVIITIGLAILDKVLPDPKVRSQAKTALLKLQKEGLLKEIESSLEVINSEARSEHWVVAAWRPITMLTFTTIIANNYILYPYLSLLWENAPILKLPDNLWDLLKIGLGGYVIGRSGEKMMKSYKNG